LKRIGQIIYRRIKAGLSVAKARMWCRNGHFVMKTMPRFEYDPLKRVVKRPGSCAWRVLAGGGQFRRRQLGTEDPNHTYNGEENGEERRDRGKKWQKIGHFGNSKVPVRRNGEKNLLEARIERVKKEGGIPKQYQAFDLYV